MMVYEPLVTEGYEWIIANHHDDYDTLLDLDGKPRAVTWKPISVDRLSADGRKRYKPSDFPWLGSYALVMRRTAVDALRDLLNVHGEVLPLATDDGVELFIYNARTVDALDEARSSIEKFPGTNRIAMINKVAFIPSLIENIDIFRLPHRGMPTYVSERFVERYVAAGLRGLDFNNTGSSRGAPS